MKKYRVIGQCFTLQKGDKFDGKVLTKPLILTSGEQFETARDMRGRAVISANANVD